jgi:hypothetical protein
MADPLLDRIKNVFVPKDSAPPPSAKTTEDDTEFDEEGFREAAKSLGTFSEKEIDEYVKREKVGLKSPIAEPKAEDVEIKDPFKEFEGVAKAGAGYLGYKLGRALIPNRPDDNIPPDIPPDNPPNNPPNNKNQSLDDIKRQNLINQERRAQELHDLEIQLKQNKLSAPIAQAKPIQDRTIGGAKTITDPMLSTEIQQSTGFTGLTDLEKQTGGPITTGSDLRMIQQSEQNRLAKEAEAKVIEAKAAGVTPTTSESEAQTLVTTKANSQTPVEKATESIKPPVSSELRTGSGMPAFRGTAPPGTPLRRELESIANIPSTHVFVPGGQLMDIIRNSVGQDAFTASLGKYGYPKTQKEAHEIARAINESMGRMPRDVTKDLNIGLGENTPSITQKVGKNKEINVKGLGLGGLVAFTDLAKAYAEKEKTGNYGPLAETAFNLGTALVNRVAPLATYSGGLNTNEARELAIRRKIGGGRGVAPPGMGQR